MSINVYSINKLPKNTYSLQKETSKYYVRCREENENNQNQNSWINIIKILNLQDFDKSNKLLEIVENYKDIVIKIGEQEAIRKEYENSTKIYNLKGFVKIIWYFEYKSEGSQMKIIIMPYFEMGNIGEYSWTNENIKQLRSSIKQALLSNISAFTKGYLHGDFHPRNILLTQAKQNKIDYLLDGIDAVFDIETNGVRTMIIDYENMREVTKENKKDLIDFYFDIYKFFVLLQDYRFIKNIDKTTVTTILQIINKNMENLIYPDMDFIKNIIGSVDKIELL
jgi:serine/threonine protein kinase